jgi:hypothetical protein
MFFSLLESHGRGDSFGLDTGEEGVQYRGLREGSQVRLQDGGHEQERGHLQHRKHTERNT